MDTFQRSLLSGIVGAVTLTAIHELARRRVPDAPRMDLLGMRAVRRLAPSLAEPYLRSRDLHRLTLLGDLAANTLYYAAVPGRSQPATWARGIALGLGAGAGALLLPEPLGLGVPPRSTARSNQLMTLAWYLSGGLAAAAMACGLSALDRTAR